VLPEVIEQKLSRRLPRPSEPARERMTVFLPQAIVHVFRHRDRKHPWSDEDIRRAWLDRQANAYRAESVHFVGHPRFMQPWHEESIWEEVVLSIEAALINPIADPTHMGRHCAEMYVAGDFATIEMTCKDRGDRFDPLIALDVIAKRVGDHPRKMIFHGCLGAGIVSTRAFKNRARELIAEARKDIKEGKCDE
jgi:hypothetical protein